MALVLALYLAVLRWSWRTDCAVSLHAYCCSRLLLCKNRLKYAENCKWYSLSWTVPIQAANAPSYFVLINQGWRTCGLPLMGEVLVLTCSRTQAAYLTSLPVRADFRFWRTLLDLLCESISLPPFITSCSFVLATSCLPDREPMSKQAVASTAPPLPHHHCLGQRETREGNEQVAMVKRRSKLGWGGYYQ